MTPRESVARALAVAACLALAGCAKPAIKPSIETKRTDNPDINAELLLTIEGCHVYRFTDDRRIYVTICPASAGRTAAVDFTHLEPCGKGCVHEVRDNSLTAYQQVSP